MDALDEASIYGRDEAGLGADSFDKMTTRDGYEIHRDAVSPTMFINEEA